MSQFPKDKVDQYELMLKLADIVRKEKKGHLPYEPELYDEKYNNFKSSSDPNTRLEERDVR